MRHFPSLEFPQCDVIIRTTSIYPFVAGLADPGAPRARGQDPAQPPEAVARLHAALHRTHQELRGALARETQEARLIVGTYYLVIHIQIYRVTIHVIPNLQLTQKQNSVLVHGLILKQNYCFDVNGTLGTT